MSALSAFSQSLAQCDAVCQFCPAPATKYILDAVDGQYRTVSGDERYMCACSECQLIHSGCASGKCSRDWDHGLCHECVKMRPVRCWSDMGVPFYRACDEIIATVNP